MALRISTTDLQCLDRLSFELRNNGRITVYSETLQPIVANNRSRFKISACYMKPEMTKSNCPINHLPTDSDSGDSGPQLQLKTKERSKAEHLSVPPGPSKLPFIGSLHHLFGSLPQHRLRDLAKKYGPIMYLQLGEISNIVISSAEAAEEIMKTQDVKFSDRPPSLLFMDIIVYNRKDMAGAQYGDYWRMLRKISKNELLSVKRVQSFRSIREEEVFKLSKSISSRAGSPINLSKMIFSLTYRMTTRAAFGKLNKDAESFIPIAEEVGKLAGAGNISDLFPSIEFLPWITGMRTKMVRLHQEADKLLENIIAEHRARTAVEKSSNDGTSRGDDLVDVLLDLQDHGNHGFAFGTDNIKAFILDVFFAGTDTSSTALEWAMAEMLKNPRMMKKAQDEVRKVFGEKGYVDESGLDQLNYLKMVVKETLRFHPPLPLLVPRSCREECEINGYLIPAKSTVMVNALAIGRDSRYWKDAERFNPERFIGSTMDYKGTNFEYIPFGAGRRICPGVSFGIANVELPLANLLFHFDWELPNGMNPESLDMLESSGITAKRKNPIQVTPILRHPLPVGLYEN